MTYNSTALAQKPKTGSPREAGQGEKMLTRSELAVMLSATNFMQDKIAELWDWGSGYDIAQISQANLAPVIKFVKVAPDKAPPDGRTLLTVMAEVDDPAGRDNIKGVKADLSEIGRLSAMTMVDSGRWGDLKAGDGIYTLQSSIATGEAKGSREIRVTVVNQSGWLTVGSTKLEVRTDPRIVQTNIWPKEIFAGGRQRVTLYVQIETPGKIEDLTRVSANLVNIDGPAARDFVNDGRAGDETAGDDIFTLQITVPAWVKAGERRIPVTVENAFGGRAQADLTLRVK